MLAALGEVGSLASSAPSLVLLPPSSKADEAKNCEEYLKKKKKFPHPVPPPSVSPKAEQERGVQGLCRPKGLELWVSRAGRSLASHLQEWHGLQQDQQGSCPRERAPILPQGWLLSGHYNRSRRRYCAQPVLTPGTFTLSPTVISRSAPISTLNFARKEKESSLSRSGTVPHLLLLQERLKLLVEAQC